MFETMVNKHSENSETAVDIKKRQDEEIVSIIRSDTIKSRKNVLHFFWRNLSVTSRKFI